MYQLLKPIQCFYPIVMHYKKKPICIHYYPQVSRACWNLSRLFFGPKVRINPKVVGSQSQCKGHCRKIIGKTLADSLLGRLTISLKLQSTRFIR